MKPLGWMMAFGLIVSSGRVINFDTATIGQTPPGWTIAMTNRGAAPRWEILRDRTAPTPPYVLAQMSADANGSRFPLAILNGVELRDGDISVRLKPVAGQQEQAGGVVFRYRDPNNYYLARANALQQNVALLKVEDGRRLPIAPAVQHDLPSNSWRILKISVRANRFQVYVDHRRVLQAVDNTFQSSGKVGLWTVGDSVTYFDDFRVNPK
ncbi:MAG: hypothetical protein LAQ30_21150 [Acidobacteriia bacterium]|nr:hypothetical protein [Terriglobia bacterium]